MSRNGLAILFLFLGCATPLPQVNSVRERRVPANVELLGTRAWTSPPPKLKPPNFPPFKPIDSGIVSNLFRTLDHEEAPLREGAMQHLLKLGRGVLPVLLELRKNATPEQSWRVDMVLESAWPCPELFEDPEWGKVGRLLTPLRAALEKVEVSEVEEDDAIGLGLRFGEPEPVLVKFIEEHGLGDGTNQELELVLYHMTLWARDLEYGGAAAVMALKICEVLALRQEDRFLPYLAVLSNTPWGELRIRIRWEGLVSEGPSTYQSAISGQTGLVCGAIEKAKPKWRKALAPRFTSLILPTRMPAPRAMVHVASHGDPDEMFPIVGGAYESGDIPKTAGLDVLAVMVRITRPTANSRKFWANQVRDFVADKYPRGTGENRWESIRPRWWASLYIGVGLLQSQHPEAATLLRELATNRWDTPVPQMNDVLLRRVKGGGGLGVEGPMDLPPKAIAPVFCAIVLSGGPINKWERTILATVLNQRSTFEPQMKNLPFHTTLFEKADRLWKQKTSQENKKNNQKK